MASPFTTSSGGGGGGGSTTTTPTTTATTISTATVPSRSLGRSSSFSQRSSIPAPPPLSISRPSPSSWPPPPSTLGLPSLVEDHLFLGSDLSARDLPTLRSLRITHVLSCVGGPRPFPLALRYRILWLSDIPSQDISSVLFDVFDLLERVRLSPRRALVHCSRGVSRSPALVVAYLMWRHSLPFDVALSRVRAARPATDPNLGFASQLLSFQSRILPSSSSPSHARLYRMAPHSPYDPLHLVPKPVDRPCRSPSPSDLDPRGAFVLRAPSGRVFAWIGRFSDPAMARAASRSAAQFLRYERSTVGPVLTVEDGSESPEFRDAIGGAGPARFVPEYDLDYETYGRAAKGGVVPEFCGEGCAAPLLRVPAWECGWGSSSDDEEGEGAEAGERLMEPFGSPQSVFSRDLGTPSSSSVSEFSPASSASDWCNSSSSPGSEFFYGGEMLLDGEGRLPGDGQRMEVDTEENAGCVEEMGGVGRLCLDGEEVPTGPALFRWPGFGRLEDLHPGVLDSRSVFILLAPERSSKSSSGRSRVLYVWVGGKSPLVEGGGDAGSSERKCNVDEKLREVAREFLNLMNYPVDIPVQVVREDEEPAQFLNHLFSFHQAKDISPK